MKDDVQVFDRLLAKSLWKVGIGEKYRKDAGTTSFIIQNDGNAVLNMNGKVGWHSFARPRGLQPQPTDRLSAGQILKN